MLTTTRGRIASHGRRNSVAGLFESVSPLCHSLGTPAVAADAGGLRVASRLLAVYDAPAARRLAFPWPDSTRRGWVQADVHYDCSAAAESRSEPLAISSSIKLAPYCVIEGWVAPDRLALIATGHWRQSVSLPSYAISSQSRRPRQQPRSPGASLEWRGDHARDQFVSTTGLNGGRRQGRSAVSRYLQCQSHSAARPSCPLSGGEAFADGASARPG